MVGRSMLALGVGPLTACSVFVGDTLRWWTGSLGVTSTLRPVDEWLCFRLRRVR